MEWRIIFQVPTSSKKRYKFQYHLAYLKLSCLEICPKWLVHTHAIHEKSMQRLHAPCDQFQHSNKHKFHYLLCLPQPVGARFSSIFVLLYPHWPWNHFPEHEGDVIAIYNFKNLAAKRYQAEHFDDICTIKVYINYYSIRVNTLVKASVNSSNLSMQLLFFLI